MGGQQSKLDEVIAHIQRETGYQFQNKELVVEALRHGSTRGTSQTLGLQSFERLEFLGDSLLQVVISEYLFKKHPRAQQGELTEMREAYVSNSRLKVIARQLKLNELAEMGESIRYNSHSYEGYGDMVESLLGAIYLDSNESMELLFHVIVKVWGLTPLTTQSGGCVIS